MRQHAKEWSPDKLRILDNNLSLPDSFNGLIYHINLADIFQLEISVRATSIIILMEIKINKK